jgi:uncharacterized protein YndB with AHSA1/START domain
MTNIVSEVIVTIDRMPAEIWGFVSDPANLHTWMTDVDSPGEWVGGGGPTVGSRYRIDYKYGRKTNEIVFEVTAANPGARFSVNTVEGPYPITVDYTFEETGNGESTGLTMVMNARSDSTFTAVLFVLTGWFAKYFMKKRLGGEISTLKQAIESR